MPDLHTAAHEAYRAFSLNFEKYKTTDVKSVRVATGGSRGGVVQRACGITASYTDAGRVPS